MIIPAWNEEQSIAAVLDELRATCPEVPAVVVDDGSTDATARVARRAGADVIRLPFNVGVGGAMRAGFLYAVRHGHDAVVQVDADGQHDPRNVLRLLEELATADVVVGSRFAGAGSYQVHGPRRWAMRLLAGSLSRQCRTRLTDVTSGFRSAGPAAVPVFARLYPPEYLGDTVESLVVARKFGLRITEIPVTMRPRVAGAPSQGLLRATVYLARAVLVLGLAAIRSYPEMNAEHLSETVEPLS